MDCNKLVHVSVMAYCLLLLIYAQNTVAINRCSSYSGSCVEKPWKLIGELLVRVDSCPDLHKIVNKHFKYDDCKSYEICCSILIVKTVTGYKSIYPGETLAKANLQTTLPKLGNQNGSQSGSFKRKTSRNGSFNRQNSYEPPKSPKNSPNNANKSNNNTPNGQKKKRWCWFGRC